MSLTAAISFQDIFKSNFLENSSSVSIIDMVIGIILAFGIGVLIFFIYKKTYAGVMEEDLEMKTEECRHLILRMEKCHRLILRMEKCHHSILRMEKYHRLIPKTVPLF